MELSLLQLKFDQEKSSHQNQDPAKSWKNQFFNTFAIKFLTGKNNHKNQDPAKSWKDQFFNTFAIKFLTEKNSHQNQDPAKSWKNQFFNTFLICFQYFLEAQTECKKTALPPKPCFLPRTTRKNVAPNMAPWTASKTKCEIDGTIKKRSKTNMTQEFFFIFFPG